ncbi:glycosyltransferase [Raineyella sp. CBA3103]|uniref:glycosyltransferase n=1 Tax=Raineyella fluvialis TaxID=2662261 RepID=UPI00189090DE
MSESLATGVLDVVIRLVREQHALGNEISVLYSRRGDSPTETELSCLLPGVRIHAVGSLSQNRLQRTRSLRRRLRSLTQLEEFDIVHLHSTFAGIAGRTIDINCRCIYSPHGFSFLRSDKGRFMRSLYRTLERTLASRTDLIIGVSSDEVSIACDELSARAVLLRNVLDIDSLPPKPALGSRFPIVANIGRWSAQKAPERFERAAEALWKMAEFRWIGAGVDEPKSARVTGTGWLSHSQVLDELTQVNLIYFTSRWEGMPVGLMEAQAMGIPAVAIRCTGVADVVIDGVTGVIVEDEEQGMHALKALLEDEKRLGKMSLDAWRNRDRFSASGYGTRSLKAYQEVKTCD